MKITKRQLRRIIREAVGGYGQSDDGGWYIEVDGEELDRDAAYDLMNDTDDEELRKELEDEINRAEEDTSIW